MPRLLMIAYDFPPIGGGGVRRILKFMRLLPASGWQPVILTVKKPYNRPIDLSLLDQIPADVPVIRAATAEHCFLGNGASIHAAGTGSEAGPATVRSHLKTLLRRVIFPDSRILWAPFAWAVALRAALKLRFEIIYATGPSFATFITGWVLSLALRLPLVIDYRDGWLGDPNRAPRSQPFESIENWLEGRIIHHSRLVVCTTKGILQELCSRFPHERVEKFLFLPNGYDLADRITLGDIPSALKSDRLVLSCIGTLGPSRNPRYFLEAVRALCDQIGGNRIEVRFVGGVSTYEGVSFEHLVARFGLGDVVTNYGFVPRQESIEHMFAANVLIALIDQVQPERMPFLGLAGKLFDYLLADRPILCLSEEGGQAVKLIREAKLGYTAPAKDPDAILQVLKTIYEQAEQDTLHVEPDWQALACYDVAHLTAKLAANLFDLLRQGPRPQQIKG